MSVRFSKEFGLNSSIALCPICKKEVGIALFGAEYKNDKGKTIQAPREIIGTELCNSCIEKAKQENSMYFASVIKKDNEERIDGIITINKNGIVNSDKFDIITFMPKDVFDEVFGELIKNYQNK